MSELTVLNEIIEIIEQLSNLTVASNKATTVLSELVMTYDDRDKEKLSKKLSYHAPAIMDFINIAIDYISYTQSGSETLLDNLLQYTDELREKLTKNETEENLVDSIYDLDQVTIPEEYEITMNQAKAIINKNQGSVYECIADAVKFGYIASKREALVID